MDGHDGLERLKREIAADLAPVRPLARPAVRAVGLGAGCLAMGLLVVAVAGPRADIALLGPWASVGLSLAQLTAAPILVGLALAWSIPAMSGSMVAAALSVSLALAGHLAIGTLTQEMSALAPLPGRELTTGLACVAAITGLALTPLAVGAVLLSHGVLTRVIPALVVTAVAATLTGDAIWRLHCPYSTWAHVLPFHTGALVPVTVLALGLAKRGSSARSTSRGNAARMTR